MKGLFMGMLNARNGWGLIRPYLLVGGMTLVLTLAACSSEPPKPVTPFGRDLLSQKVHGVLLQFEEANGNIKFFKKHAYGYVVFPTVTTGALAVGGGEGRGEVFKHGQLYGYAKLIQASIGAQIGGQTYSELIFFENSVAFSEFEAGTTTFDARATAIAAQAGAGTAVNYQRGVLVYTLPQGGLMAQAAIGGQKFRFQPLNAK